MKCQISLLCVVSFFLASWFTYGEDKPSGSQALSRLRVEKGMLLDSTNRQIILHGVNLGRKNSPFLPKVTEKDYARLEQWGMNCIRFYINWAALEPQPNQYDLSFLKKLDEHVRLANLHGLYVIIDFHQDLFSGAVPGGNGAPTWATLDENKSHVTTKGSWGIAYFTSPKVHQAFDSFWENKPAQDGLGLQEHFTTAAAWVAKHYKDSPGVIGFDLLNEPALGSDVLKASSALFANATTLMALPNPPKGLLVSLLNPEEADALLKYSERKDIYTWLIEALEPVLQRFEREKLQPFYNRVGNAIRDSNSDAIIFFEPGILANSGAMSAIEPVISADGKPISGQMYAPHAYDLVTDTPQVAEANPMRLEIMFENIAQRITEMHLPCIIGEWGAYYGNNNAAPAARMVVTLMEKYKLSDTYWDYHSDLDRKAFFNQLCRPYPQAVAGTLEEWCFDQDRLVFTLKWQEMETAKGSTQLYVPKIWFKEKSHVILSPKSDFVWFDCPGNNSWILEIETTGKGMRSLILQ